MTAYYNEIDSDAAAWLRELIAAGHIAPGIVDERSIEDVTPTDLAPFTQCHFFAGIGIWSYALRAAGVTDDTRIWTGSCPCQPFSSAGQGAGFDDERHLWPHWQYLISQCKPSAIVGEQVASKDAGPWIDLVHDDLEALGYAFGAVPFPSAGVGAPHIRDRLYWVANAERSGIRGGGYATNGNPQSPLLGEIRKQRVRIDIGAICSAESDGMADTDGQIEGGRGVFGPGKSDGASAGQPRGRLAGLCAAGGLADTDGRPNGREGENLPQPNVGRLAAGDGFSVAQSEPTGPVNGFWADADWLYCRDGKWRPVEPGTQPLAYGMPRSVGALSPELQRLAEVAGLSSASLKRAKAYRVGALRGYGNAINAEAARLFIESCLK